MDELTGRNLLSPLSGIILAGGRSQRMGTDKALLPFPGDSSPSSTSPTTFLTRLTAVLTSCCTEVVVVARDPAQASLYANLDDPSVRLICDSVPGGGPLIGLSSGLSAIKTPAAFVVAVDMPFIEPAMLSHLHALYRDDTLLIPLVGGIPQVMLAIYPRSILPIIREHIEQGQRSLRCLLEAAPVQYIEEAQLRQADPQLRSFVGVNTPQEMGNLHL